MAFSKNFGSLLLFLQFLAHMEALNPRETALIIVDVQNDFCAGGIVSVPYADQVIPVINELRARVNFSKTIFALDWHPLGHVSFYERFSDKEKYPDAKLFQEFTIDLEDGKGQRTQRLYPEHCIQNSIGAAVRIGLDILPTDVIVHKGTDPDVDSYSGFTSNDRTQETELDQVLKDAGIKEIVVVGVAFEYSVGLTALDGITKGYSVSIIEDAVGFIHDPESNNKELMTMRQNLRKAGVEIRSSDSVLAENTD